MVTLCTLIGTFLGASLTVAHRRGFASLRSEIISIDFIGPVVICALVVSATVLAITGA